MKLLKLVLVVMLLYACKNSTEVENVVDFIKLEVTDINKEPVQGLEIHIENLTNVNQIRTQNNTFNTICKIKFALPFRCRVEMLSKDYINGSVIDTLVLEEMWPGIYMLYYEITDFSKSEIREISIKAYALDTNELLFNKSQIAVINRIYPIQTKIGETNAEGKFYFSNRKMITSAYSLPKLMHTNENGETLGEFYFKDSIKIILKNNSTEKEYIKSLAGNRNNYILNWDKGIEFKKSFDYRIKQRVKLEKRGDFLPIYFELSSPFPNPLN